MYVHNWRLQHKIAQKSQQSSSALRGCWRTKLVGAGAVTVHSYAFALVQTDILLWSGSGINLKMAFSLLQKFFFVVLIGQTILSILNTQFTLADANAAVAIFGFYGAVRNHRHSLLLVRTPLNTHPGFFNQFILYASY
jgi:hypothetical protein